MTDIEIHIAKKIPFVLTTKEGEEIVVFPGEKRFVKGSINAVVHNEDTFNDELKKLFSEYINFQSLRPKKE